jgi:uncharacterized repeat protein (TIGR01451 family)
MRKIYLLVLVGVMLAAPAVCLASPKIEMKIIAEKPVVVKKDGNKIVKMEAVSKIIPGEVITYTIKYKNAGDEVAVDAVFEDAVPKGMTYSPDSAEGKDSDITFSIDGKTFDKPPLLTYEVKNAAGKITKRNALPEEYTNIRWVVKKIMPGEEGTVSFKAKIQ